MMKSAEIRNCYIKNLEKKKRESSAYNQMKKKDNDTGLTTPATNDIPKWTTPTTKARQKHQLMTTRQTPATERSKSKTAEPKEKRKKENAVKKKKKFM